MSMSVVIRLDVVTSYDSPMLSKGHISTSSSNIGSGRKTDKPRIQQHLRWILRRYINTTNIMISVIPVAAMCRVYLVICPCNHTVLAAHIPCAAGQHPQICNPPISTVTIKLHEEWPLGPPPTCPGCKDGQHLILPVEPTAFAEYCIQRNIGIVDAVAVMPAWIYDSRGNKVGTRSKPWRICDYVVAWYCAKSPKSIRNRVGTEGLGGWPIRKRKANVEESAAKRAKTSHEQALDCTHTDRSGVVKLETPEDAKTETNSPADAEIKRES